MLVPLFIESSIQFDYLVGFIGIIYRGVAGSQFPEVGRTVSNGIFGLIPSVGFLAFLIGIVSIDTQTVVEEIELGTDGVLKTVVAYAPVAAIV